MIHAEGPRVEMDGSELDIIVEFQCICATMCDVGYPVEHLHECVENGFQAWTKKQERNKKIAKGLIKKVVKNAQANKGNGDK